MTKQLRRNFSIFANTLGLICLSACQFDTPSSSTSTDNITFGYVDNGCWITDSETGAQAPPIHIYDLATQKTVTSTASAMLKNTQTCGEFQTKSVKASSPNAQFHKINQDIDFGIGWSGQTPSALDEYDFTSCTTSEGLRYRVTHKQTEVILWEGYQALGYDSESNCRN